MMHTPLVMSSKKVNLDVEPAMCPCCPENQPYPGLHQKKCGQHGKGGEPPPLLSSSESSPVAPRPDVESSVQERHGPAGVHPEEGHRK